MSTSPLRIRAPAVVLGTGATVTGRILLGPLLPEIRASLGLSSLMAGLALTAFSFVAALTHFPAGRLADGRSHQLVLAGGFGAIAGGTALLATTTTSLQFVLALLLYALGMGLYMPGAIIYLSAQFAHRQGLVLGLNSGAAQLGGIAASLLALAALGSGRWQLAFVPMLAVVLVLGTIVHVSRSEPYEPGRVSLDVRATLRRLLGNRHRRRAILAAATLMIGMEAALVFLPTFLQEAKSFPSSLASNTFAMYFVVGLLVNPVAGRLADRFRPRSTAAAAVGIAVAGIATLVVATSNEVLLAGVVLLGAGIAGFWPPFNTHLMTVLSESGRGSEYGAARTVWIAIGSTGPAIVGTVGGAFDYATAFAVIGVVLCLTVVILVLGDVEDDAHR